MRSFNNSSCRANQRTLNPRLLTLPARFRQSTHTSPDGNVLINAQPPSPQSAPIVMSRSVDHPEPRRVEPRTERPSPLKNPFVNVLESEERESQDRGEPAPGPSDCKKGQPDSERNASIPLSSNIRGATVSDETVASSADIPTTRKLKISLARKAESISQLLRSDRPKIDLKQARIRAQRNAYDHRSHAVAHLTEARQAWEAALKGLRDGVDLLEESVLPDIIEAVEIAEKNVFASILGDLCIASARTAREADLGN